MTWSSFDKLMLDSICILSCTGDNALFTSDLILDFNFVRPVLIDLLDLLAAEFDVPKLFASIFLVVSTGVSLNGTF